MKSHLAFLAFAMLATVALPPLTAQELSGEIDLLYPELSHPDRDVAEAIARRDYRFLSIDRARKVVPGMEHGRRLRRIYGVRVMRQRLRLFPTASQIFSYNLRARAYAEEYNLTMAKYLLAHHPERY